MACMMYTRICFYKLQFMLYHSNVLLCMKE